jgi:hypothetical protein
MTPPSYHSLRIVVDPDALEVFTRLNEDTDYDGPLIDLIDHDDHSVIFAPIDPTVVGDLLIWLSDNFKISPLALDLRYLTIYEEGVTDVPANYTTRGLTLEQRQDLRLVLEGGRKDATTRMRDERMLACIDAAAQAFWTAVAEHFPDATAGDLEPLIMNSLANTMMSTVASWCRTNVPGYEDHMPGYAAYTHLIRGADVARALKHEANLAPHEDETDCPDPENCRAHSWVVKS